ncbi:MAG TPA: glycosyltransferase family 9 protein [Longimicrobiales bacterium]|nr:glycosyltransferase family 9 protein [Longimicrobiales bacterium]
MTLQVGQPREILIVMLSALGDAVHVLPVVNALKRHWPDSRITWLIQPVPHMLVQGHENVDEFILFHRRRGTDALRSFSGASKALAGRRFDLLINLQVYLKAGLLTSIARADVKLGFDRKRARDMNWLFTTHRIPPRPPGHVQDQYFEFIQHLGINPEPVEWRLPLTDAERVAQREFLDGLDRPMCGVVVGTSKTAKNWAPERYARLLEVLEADYGYRTVLLGGPSAAEKAAAAQILLDTRAQPVDALANDVRRLLWLLDGSSLVVSPDTGPLHAARALDRPVVGLYGYTNPKRYGPYRRPWQVVDGYAKFAGEDYGPAAGYRSDGMDRITVEMVLEGVERVKRHEAGDVGRAT